jgi:hypothetical protein
MSNTNNKRNILLDVIKVVAILLYFGGMTYFMIVAFIPIVIWPYLKASPQWFWYVMGAIALFLIVAPFYKPFRKKK